MTINKALQILMIIKNIKQINIANKLEQSKANISHMLNKSHIDSDYLIDYANVCGCEG